MRGSWTGPRASTGAPEARSRTSRRLGPFPPPTTTSSAWRRRPRQRRSGAPTAPWPASIIRTPPAPAPGRGWRRSTRRGSCCRIPADGRSTTPRCGDGRLDPFPSASAWPAQGPGDLDDAEGFVPIRHPLARLGIPLPWLIVFVALGVIFVFTAYAVRPTSGGSGGAPDGVLEVGSCVTVAAVGAVVETGCNAPARGPGGGDPSRAGSTATTAPRPTPTGLAAGWSASAGVVPGRRGVAGSLLGCRPLGRLAQLEERHVHTVEVMGSRPVSPTSKVPVHRCTPSAQDSPTRKANWRPGADTVEAPGPGL